MHKVVKVKYKGKLRYFTTGAYHLAKGGDISNNTNNVKEVERFTVINALDLENEMDGKS